MPFVKVIKNKAYFKRFQVKFKRRRSGHTDYRQRHKLITQDKNKYGSPKYRLCVRFSNRYVLCQIIYAEVTGDKVLCQAHSRELQKHYDLKVGLKNYAAAYCTGLLLARRLLKQIGLEETYPGVEEVTGEVKSWKASGEEIKDGERCNARNFYVEVEEDCEKKPFRCLLDVGIKNTTTGSRVFAAMKGASDGGLDIPHSNKRFPGYVRDTKTFDAETLKGHIMGEHVADYMREMEEDDEENYKKHFAKYCEEDKEADELEEMYTAVHAAIRESPEFKNETFSGKTGAERRAQRKAQFGKDKQYKKGIKKTYEERKASIKEKKEAMAAEEEEEEEEEA